MAKTLVFSYIYGLELLKHVCSDTSHAQRAPQGSAVVPQGETGAPRWVMLVSDAGPGLLHGARLPQPRWEFRLCLNPKREELRVDAHLAVWGGK